MADVFSPSSPRDTFEFRTTNEPEESARRLADELLAVERRAQEQVAWVLAVTILLLLAVGAHFLPGVDPIHSRMINLVGGGLVAWFTIVALSIRRSHYAPWFKYVNAAIQVTMVTAVIAIDADMRGPLYALSSMPPLFYGFVVGVSSLSLSPGLCLAVGSLASAEFLALYALYLRPMIVARNLTHEASIGWDVTAMKAIILVAIGVTAMLMARKARQLLSRVVAEARAEEKLRAVENEMALASEIQRRLIPDLVQSGGGFDVASVYRPAKNVGGDYFDVIETGPRKRLIVVADVSGKGFSAALTMSNVQAMARVLATRGTSLDSMAAEINASLVENAVRGRFVTMAIVAIDAASGRLSYVNAGHGTPIVVLPDGRVESLDRGGPVLGVIDDVRFDVGEAAFPVGAVLCAYTDGLSELKNAGGALLGLESIIQTATGARETGAEGVKAALLADAERHLAGGAPHDDLTLVVVRHRGA